MRSHGSVLVMLSILVLVARSAHGVVLASGSDAQKHRRDVGKQAAKYIQCLVKVSLKCEQNGDEADQECFLTTGTVQPGDPNLDQADFQARIAKCDSKLILAKKSPSGGSDPVGDYEGIGCPGDSDTVAGGDQRYADLNAYQTGVKTATKSALQTLGLLLCGVVCAADCGDDSQTNRDCLEDDAKALSQYAKGIGTCRDKCEKDYKVPDSAGGGGPTDDSQICTVSGTGAPNFDTCTAKPAAKLSSTASAGASAVVKPAVDGQLDDAANDLFNECDCGAGVPPCP